jgi:hypothetical protein
MARFIGKCPRCKKLHKVEGSLVVEPRFKVTAMVGTVRADKWKGRWVVSVDCCPRRANDLTGGLNTVQLEKVFAAAVTTHKCGAKCRNATGPSCECSCKGEHHGEG